MAEKKAIWGSTRYFIEIEPNTNLFNTSMSGTVSFYDTRDLINEKHCDNLHDLVRTVYDFWATILAPHETRVARWIEEYFNNMGIRSEYSLILRLIKSEELIEQQIEELILETIAISTEQYLGPMNIDEESNIIGRIVKIRNLPDDEFIMNELIQKIIQSHQITVENKITGIHEFQLINGESKKIEITKNISIGETIGSYSVLTSVINRYDTKMENIVVKDFVPYSYSVLMTDIKGKEEKITKEVRKGEENLEIIWKIPELEPKERVEITYYLKRRINRIILELKEKEITVLKVFENISPYNLEYAASIKYININNIPLKEVYIADTIPPEFNILKTKPEAIAPQGIIERAKMKGITIRWKHKNVKPQEVIEKEYQLDYFPYLLRGKKVVQDKDGNEILKCLKILQPSTRASGYKILYDIKPLKRIKNLLSITDTIPASHVVVEIQPPDSQILEETVDEKKKRITWVVDSPERFMEVKVVLTVSADTQPLFELFEIQIGEKKETEVIEKEIEVQRELVAYNLDKNEI
ncbi:MAG: hypothetical protein ACTSSG_06440 [Candidatus Heimdallarchaeaceae archaeon]